MSSPSSSSSSSFGQLLTQLLEQSVSDDSESARAQVDGTEEVHDGPHAEVEARVADVLAEYEQLDSETKRQRIVSLHNHVELCQAICARLLHRWHGKEQDAVCRWLFQLYWGGTGSERLFVLQFVPLFVWTLMLARMRSQSVSGVATCLLAVYNNEIRENRESETEARVPDVAACDSVFHTAPDKSDSRNHRPLSESALKEHNTSSAEAASGSMSPSKQKLPAVRSLVNQDTLLLVLHVCLRRYNAHISSMPMASQQQMCAVAMQLAGMQEASLEEFMQLAKGMAWQWTWPGREHSHHFRHTLSKPLLEDFIEGITFCLSYPWTKDVAVLALKQVHNRALEQLTPELLLQTSCLLESL